MLNIRIKTFDLEKDEEACKEMECDITHYKAGAWLQNHIVWAMSQGYGIQIERKED